MKILENGVYREPAHSVEEMRAIKKEIRTRAEPMLRRFERQDEASSP